MWLAQTLPIGQVEPPSSLADRDDVVSFNSTRSAARLLTDLIAGQDSSTPDSMLGVIDCHPSEPKKFWGVSDVTAVRESIIELNRALSQLSMILELSGNPVAVLENVTEAQDIAVQPGAVWELPERARAYLLDLLQGGGVSLHVDYINMIYRTLHDLGESPRTAFGDNHANLSGVALNVEMDPLLKKVGRKRLLRESAFKRRNEMILRLLQQYTGANYAPYRSQVVWGSLLPQDRSRLVQDETRLVAAGIHSRRRAADELGVADPEAEFRRWREEEGLHPE